MYRVDQTEVIPFAKSTNHLTKNQEEENKTLLAMLNNVLHTPQLFYSKTTDLTLTVQRSKSKVIKATYNPEGTDLDSVMRFYDGCDERFLWNGNLLTG